jgi:hypothetical protein
MSTTVMNQKVYELFNAIQSLVDVDSHILEVLANKKEATKILAQLKGEPTMTEVQRIKFFYLRNERGFPVACIASQFQGETHVKYAVSTHNPLDTYSKNRARNIAVGRLAMGTPYSSYVKEDDKNYSSFVGEVEVSDCIKATILEDITCDNYFPQRTRDAAKLWLTKFGPVEEEEEEIEEEHLVQREPAINGWDNEGGLVVGGELEEYE